jgi:hypothetical protein
MTGRCSALLRIPEAIQDCQLTNFELMASSTALSRIRKDGADYQTMSSDLVALILLNPKAVAIKVRYCYPP